MTQLDELLRAVDNVAEVYATDGLYRAVEVLEDAAQRVRTWLAEPVLSDDELFDTYSSADNQSFVSREGLRAVERAVKAKGQR